MGVELMNESGPTSSSQWQSRHILGAEPEAFLHDQPSMWFLFDVLMCYSENYKIMKCRSELIQVNL